jgi:hypothetical protein
LLGHPLGGAGTEVALTWRFDLPTSGLSISGRAFRRRRGAENLFAPDRMGAGHGGAFNLRIPVGRMDVTVDGSGEFGVDRWHASRLLVTGFIAL